MIRSEFFGDRSRGLRFRIISFVESDRKRVEFRIGYFACDADDRGRIESARKKKCDRHVAKEMVRDRVAKSFSQLAYPRSRVAHTLARRRTEHVRESLRLSHGRCVPAAI